MILLLALLLAMPQAGTYGAVCFDPAKGDLNGTRVVLSGTEAAPEVLFQHCAPSCTRHRTVSASLNRDRLEFEIASLAKEDQRAKFSGRVNGKAMTLDGLTPSYGFKRATLRINQRCPKDTVLADP